jgi:hypothetical protein
MNFGAMDNVLNESFPLLLTLKYLLKRVLASNLFYIVNT